MRKLEGKVAVVTGGTSGMGRAIALRFAREGAAVVVGGRNRDRGESVVSEIERGGGEALFVAGDVARPETNRELIAEAAGRFGGLHVLVPNAGNLGLGSITEIDPDTWRETVDINLHAVFHLLRFGIPHIQRSGGGSIVATGSIAAFKGFPNHAAYCASKGALVPLIKQVAMDYAPAVRANILCPGPVDTPLIWESAAAFPVPEKAVSDAAARNPMKRLGLPEDIADAALFLACDDSRWITGAALTIDGGITCL